jgi:hypothetical protein
MDSSFSSSKVARAWIWALLFCLAVAVGGYLARNELIPFFMTRPSLNGLITCLLVIGLVLSFYHLGRLLRQARTMDGLAAQLADSLPLHEDTLEKAIRNAGRGLVADRCIRTVKAVTRGENPEAVTLLSEADMESEEGRGIAVRYLLGVMVFLGLIGTFWGVLLTVGGVQKVLESLEPDRIADAAQFVEQLKGSMGGLLGGMSTAFSTSLFGLGGSVILGFLDAQTRRARSAVLSDLDRFVVTALIPATAVYEARTVGQPAVSRRRVPPAELQVIASQQALAENFRRLAEVMANQSATDEKLTNAIVEMKGMLESLQQDQKLTQESIRIANQVRQSILDRMKSLEQQMERLVKETRLSRDSTEVIGRAFLDRLKLEGEITNKTLSIGFSDLIRAIDPQGTKSDLTNEFREGDG